MILNLFNMRLLKQAWMPISLLLLFFVSCGESPIPLKINPEAQGFIYYNCSENKLNHICGIWSYHDGQLWDVIITDKGLEEYPI